MVVVENRGLIAWCCIPEQDLITIARHPVLTEISEVIRRSITRGPRRPREQNTPTPGMWRLPKMCDRHTHKTPRERWSRVRRWAGKSSPHRSWRRDIPHRTLGQRTAERERHPRP
jgi:hypothetical protein